MTTFGGPVSSKEGGTPHQTRPQASYHSRCKTKALKALDSKRRYVLGHDVFFDKVETLCCRALIGRLEYCSMSKEEWIDWATVHWKPIIHYIPTINLLANKWLVFVFIEEKMPCVF